VSETSGGYLRAPEFARLWQAAREAYERNGGLRGTATVRGLSEDEAVAFTGLLRRREPLRAGGQLRLGLRALDATLREFAGPLEPWLVELGGTLRSRPAQREQATRRDQALWSELERAALAVDARLAGVVAELRSSGLLRRLARGTELQLGARAIDVLGSILELRGASVDLAVLAVRLCGDAKALNDGRPLATVVVRGLALLAGEPVPSSATARRELWERHGVACDPLSSHVLFLNLPVANGPGIAAAVAAHRDAGEPMRLTLRALRDLTLPFDRGATIRVCENPTVVSAAADALGAACAPLVCTEGRPVVAVQRLLAQAASAGCTLGYHGDFDWPGLAMAADAIRRYGARPWRLSAADYRAALAGDGNAKALAGAPTPTPWDPPLELALQAAGVVVEEEAVIGVLLADLGSPATALT
jgi:uncharacterized protein (TIGR02679 family)